MTQEQKDKALEQFKELAEGGDTEAIHIRADELLLAIIGDPDITQAFTELRKWYA